MEKNIKLLQDAIKKGVSTFAKDFCEKHSINYEYIGENKYDSTVRMLYVPDLDIILNESLRQKMEQDKILQVLKSVEILPIDYLQSNNIGWVKVESYYLPKFDLFKWQMIK